MVRLHCRLERQSSKRVVVGSSPAVAKQFSFCYSRFLSRASQFDKTITNEINRDIHLFFSLFS